MVFGAACARSASRVRGTVTSLRHPSQCFRRWKGCQALVLNTGSSSIKYAVYDVLGPTETRLDCKGLIEGVGLPAGSLGAHKHSPGSGQEKKYQVEVPNHVAGLERIFATLPQETLDSIQVVGHRVVNGGSDLTTPVVVDEAVEEIIQGACLLAPLHNPANLSGIRAAKAVWASIPHVAVFDTSFHSTMPPEAYRYAVPKEWYEKYGVRKYGFHGTSYSYILSQVAQELKKLPSNLNLIVCHLGSGASMCCIRGGKSVDTTMGLTPLDGLVMGTRSGDVDGGIFRHMETVAKMPVKDVDTALNKKSGLLGVCQNSDMRAVHSAAEDGDEDALLAERLFIERVRKYLGSYLLKLRGQVDAVVFTAGIGENDAKTRELVCEGLEEFGIKLDKGKNVGAMGLARIEDTFSRTKVMVVPTDEEVSIALQSIELVGLLPEEVEEAASTFVPKGRHKKPVHDLYILGANTQSILAEEVGLAKQIFPEIMAWSGKCGYFRIFADGPDDQHISLMNEHFHLGGSYEEMHGLTLEEAVSMDPGSEAVFTHVINKFKKYRKDKDFVIVSGNFVTSAGRLANYRFASALNLPVMHVYDVQQMAKRGPGSLPETAAFNAFEKAQVSESDVKAAMLNLSQAKNTMAAEGVTSGGVILSHLPASLTDTATAGLQKIEMEPVALLPPQPLLSCHTVAELASLLGATILHGADLADRIEIHNVSVGTVHVEDMLRVLDERKNCMVVVSGKRYDVILALMFAVQSTLGPQLSAILLTGTKQLDGSVQRILAGARATIPILTFHENTYLTTMRLAHIPPTIFPGSHGKIGLADSSMASGLSKDFMARLMKEGGEGEAEQAMVTPRAFHLRSIQEASMLKKRILFPEGTNRSVVAAAAELLRGNYCKVSLIGNPEEVQRVAKEVNADISAATIVDHRNSPELLDKLVETVLEERRDDGMTRAKALIRLKDVNVFGALMLREGLCDGIVGGVEYSLYNVLRPAMRYIPKLDGCQTVSSVYVMLLTDGVSLFGDGCLIQEPTAQELAEIAATSAYTAMQLGLPPRVAMLLKDDGSQSDDRVTAARGLAESLIPKVCGRKTRLDGPMAFTDAMNSGPNVEDNARATVLTFPSLSEGNSVYQTVQQAAKCKVVGPILQGLARPVNDVPSGASLQTIVDIAIITCLQAQPLPKS